MAERVNFKLTKPWGMYKKGHVFENMKKSRARSLQDVRKVGKMEKPKADKADPEAKGRATK
jgi:hypothetical protein